MVTGKMSIQLQKCFTDHRSYLKRNFVNDRCLLMTVLCCLRSLMTRRSCPSLQIWGGEDMSTLLEQEGKMTSTDSFQAAVQKVKTALRKHLGGTPPHRLGFGMCHFLGYFFSLKINFWVYFIACNKFLGQDFSLE